MLLLGLAPLLAGGLRAQGVESWNSFEQPLIARSRWMWGWDTGIRLGDGLGNVTDRRVATSVSYTVGPRLSVGARYMIRHKDWPGIAGIDFDQRLAGAIQYPLLQRAIRIKGSTFYEWHFGRPGVRDSSRYRQWLELQFSGRKLSPFMVQDLAFERSGLARWRGRGGVHWQAHDSYRISLAYQFQSVRLGGTWLPQHAVVTEISTTRSWFSGKH